MKTPLRLLLLVLLMTQTVRAAVQPLPFTDHFTYSQGNLFVVAPGVWDAGGSTGPELMVTNPAALTAPANFDAATGKGVRWQPSGTARRSIVQFGSVSSGTLYASFLINVISPPSSGSRLVAYFDSSTSQPSNPQLGFFVSNGSVGVGKKSTTPGATVSTGSGTHLVVVRYTFTGTSSDQVDIWVDPSSSSYGAANAPAASGTTSGGNNVASIPYFGIYAASGTGPSLYIDEVRIGTNWAAVTPGTGAPPSSTPQITQTLISGGNVILRGTNGTPNTGFEILSSTNIALPIAQWDVTGSNTFNVLGDFDTTNPVLAGVSQSFYRLRVGGSSNPPAATPPGISSHPQNQSVLLGQSAQFNVTATGTAPLSYQWFFNTNSLIANATNATYTIGSVSSNDIGNYSVTITNSAGATNSGSATLIITGSPTPPAITSQPQNKTVLVGQAASFTVTASGTAPLRYQWFFNTNSPLANATNATYNLTSVVSNNAGFYSVIVTNLAGLTNSDFASLSVTSAPPVAPGITGQPQSQSVTEGQGVSFTVIATGTAPLRYQWFFNTNTPIANATNAAYSINSTTTNDVGSYSVAITNMAGSTNSIVAMLTLTEAPTNGDFYVSPSGNDSNPGTLAKPFATIPRAVLAVTPGGIIYVRGGVHNYASTIRLTNSGTALAPIQLLAYPGEHPVLSFSNQPYGSNNRGILITTNGNHWRFKGLEITSAGDNAVKVEGSHHRFEQCVFHHNGDTGLQIGFGHDDDNPGANLAAFIDVINCDSYRNYDSDNRGSDADGFAAKLHCGQGIVFMGCRAWENSDDGWDLFETDASVVISNCWAWHSGDGALFPGSGSFQGNGNGIKLGGNGAGGSSRGTHYSYNCIAFNCNYKSSAQCFTQNSHKDGEVIVNCLAFGASGYNYFFEGGVNSGKANVFTNNVGIPRSGTSGNISFDPPTTEVNNSWNLVVTASTSDYGDLSEAAAKAPRQSDGSLPDGFARLVAGSDLIDKGVDVGQPFNGSARDLGPYEYSP